MATKQPTVICAMTFLAVFIAGCSNQNHSSSAMDKTFGENDSVSKATLEDNRIDAEIINKISDAINKNGKPFDLQKISLLGRDYILYSVDAGSGLYVINGYLFDVTEGNVSKKLQVSGGNKYIGLKAIVSDERIRVFGETHGGTLSANELAQFSPTS